MFRCYAIEMLYSPKDDLLYTSREFDSYEDQLPAKLVQYDIIDFDIGSSLHFLTVMEDSVGMAFSHFSSSCV